MSRFLLNAAKALVRSALVAVIPFAVRIGFPVPRATFRAEHWRAKPGKEGFVARTHAQIAAMRARGRDGAADLELAWLKANHMDLIWSGEQKNGVTTAGINDLLDRYLAGSSYTAAWFLGLISSVSYSALAAGDTAASHAGWTEAGATNAPNYSSGTRPAITFAAASAGSKASASAVSFTFSGAGTVKGCFTISNSTKDGTTGVLYSTALFTGGDRVVAASDVVNVSLTYTA